jgi:hypothetical protein
MQHGTAAVLAAHVSECNDPSHLIGSENLEQLPQQVAIGV